MRVFLSNYNKLTKDNRDKYFKKNQIDPSCVVLAELVHKDNIKIINSLDKNKVIKNVDALITNDPNICLALTAADCLIVYIYEAKNNIIALVHAGWRGLLKEIITKTISKIIKQYNSKPGDFSVSISPHIQKCHFQIQNDILSKFNNYNQFIEKDKNIFVDLTKIAKKQILDSKIPEKNITISSECTYCLKDKYFSYRRNGNKNLETMIAYIKLNNN